MASEYNSTTDFLQQQATTSLTAAQNNASRIWGLQNVDANTRDPRFNITLEEPNIGPPPSFEDIWGKDNSDPTIKWLDEQAEKWIAKYFPEINGCFKNQPEETLCEIISGVRPYGLDKTVLELVWHQARDRAQRTANSEYRTIEADYSARGFTMPSGAMVAAQIAVRDRATSQVMDVNRDQAIKDADIKVDIFKTALTLATQLKTAILNALADFYRMWISVPNQDIERARVRAQAQAALYGALSSYYNVEIAFQELRLKAEQTKAEVDLGVDRNVLTKQNNYMGIAPSLAQSVSAFANTASGANQAGGSLTAQIESL